MQHYSVPTRLLDWSESIFPALYFAVKDDEKSDGELIALNAYRLNSISKPHPTISTPDDYRVVIRAEMAGTRSSRTLKLQKTVIEALKEAPEEERADIEWTNFRRPIAVFPRRLNDRMILQSSVFTLHGGKHYVRGMEEKRYRDERLPSPISLEEIDEERPHGGPILERFLIRSDDKREILRDLFRMGIHEGTLFPEVDRQAIYLQQCWWYANED